MMRSIALAALLSVSCTFAQTDSLTVVPIGEQRLHDIITHRNGRDLFLNVWATWCIPCMEEFPDIIRLAEETKAGADNVEFILVSADYPDEIESQIKPFLRKFPTIPFQVYVADFESMDRFISSLNKDWTGSIPATFLYDSTGTQRKMLIGQQSLEQFRTAMRAVMHPSRP